MVVESAAAAGNDLEGLLARHRSSRKGLLECDISFSWWKCVISLVSYVLMLSDVLRSGPGIHKNTLPRIEPSEVIFFGPYAYSVLHAWGNDITGTHAMWPYKFDTTSVSIRAYAEFLGLQTWPPCLFYKKSCPHSTLKVSTSFQMLDALVNAIAARESRRSRAHSQQRLTLRVTNAWFDRIHHFIFPQVFGDHMTRTSQALYYDAKMLSTPVFQFCSTGNRPRPYACSRIASNFARTCTKSNSLCQGVGHIWQHALARKQQLQQQYSNLTLDILVVESQTDHSTGAFSFQGRQFLDVVVLTRIRNCTTAKAVSYNHTFAMGSTASSKSCSTVVIDDFRYDAASISSDVTNWYVVIASVRCLGQIYAWIRVLMLFLGCYYARSAEEHFAGTRLYVRVLAAVRTMFLIPSQGIVYGSMFPIGCYVFAHSLDSAVVYDYVSQAFNTPLGVFKLNVSEFLVISAVSMRSVWMLAITLHLAVLSVTSRYWSPMNGIPGLSEFSISFMSCLTIMAQFRAISFRDTRVESISEVTQSSRVANIRAATFDHSLTPGNGIDFKCLVAAGSVTCALMFTCWCVLCLLEKTKQIQHVGVYLWPRTLVSYAAGTLWPTTAFAVSWNGLFVGSRLMKRVFSNTFIRLSPPQIMPAPVISNIQRQETLRRLSQALLLHDSSTGRFLQRNMAIPDERSREVESLIYLMNLAAMTDPIVLLRLRWFGGKPIEIYESKATQRLFLIPQAARSSDDTPIVWDDYTLLGVAHTAHLPWLDLLQCG